MPYAIQYRTEDTRILADRSEVWKLLTTIALNKFRQQTARDSAVKRGGNLKREDMDRALRLEADELCGEQKLQMEEECERLLHMLGKSEIKQVALLKVEGYTNEEIAVALHCTRRTVQRRLDFIRTVWSRELDQS